MDDPERGGITGNRIYLEPRENEDISPFFFPNARDLPHFAGYTPQKIETQKEDSPRESQWNEL